MESFLGEGLANACWKTAVQAQRDLENRFKRSFKYKTLWVWLKKFAGVFRVPRPVHEKRDSEVSGIRIPGGVWIPDTISRCNRGIVARI